MRSAINARDSSFRDRGDYAVIPSLERPRLLLPLDDPRATATVVRRSGVGRKPSDRLLRGVVAGAARSGGLRLMLRHRLTLNEPGSLVDYLRRSLATDVSAIGLRAGVWRSNAKPVVQVVGPNGELLAFAKLGPTEFTARLVRAEAESLARIANTNFRTLQAPTVMHQGTWGRTEVLVLSPLEISTPAVSPKLVLDAAAELAGALDSWREPLGGSTYVRQMTSRLASLEDAEQAKRLRRVARRLEEKHSETTLRFGLGHGDFTPWNTGVRGERLAVWDWERSRPGMPVGLDLLHYYRRAGVGWLDDVPASVREAMSAVDPWLRSEGQLDDDACALLGHLYLVELVLRGLEDGDHADTNASRRLRDVGLAALEQESLLSPPGASGRSSGPMPLPTRAAASSHLRTRVWRTSARTVHIAARPSQSRRALPDFVIAGAQRAGTTSLHHYLAAHPGVHPPRLIKGVHYFDLHYERSLGWYRAHFPTVRQMSRSTERLGYSSLTYEASPYYMFHPAIPDRLAATLPGVKAIVILRDPVTRAWSQYQHERARGFETLSFEAAIAAEGARLEGEEARLLRDTGFVSPTHIHNSYVARGRYLEQLERLWRALGRENVLILESGQMRTDLPRCLARVTGFLGLPAFDLRGPQAHNTRNYPAMPTGIREELTSRFLDVNEQLFDELGQRFEWAGAGGD